MSADLQGEFGAGRSSGLTLNLASNNPFRNRAASPSAASPALSPPPHSPFDDPPPQRPVSRNPFFDAADTSATRSLKSPVDMASQDRKSQTAEEIFDNLTLDEKPATKPPPRPDGARGPLSRPPGAPPRGGGLIRGRGQGVPSSHRPTRSQEEAMRARKLQGGPGLERKGPSDAPRAQPIRRPRRNSESSVMNSEKPMTEEEKKERDARRREREKRHKEAKEKSGRPSKKLDLIDQLDATSIYGTGLFHHDGPFDALNPHRNRHGSRRAPMQAFPKDSLNNSIGGAGPLTTRPDHKTFLGQHDDEAFKDYAVLGKEAVPRPPRGGKTELGGVFDPMARGSVLHGDESMGLGTSTFLEGTPAARSAIQRKEIETAQDTVEQGMQRKKSIAQRIRGINRPGRDFSASGRITSPDGMYGPRSGELPSASSGVEKNPFFNEFDKKEERISVRDREDEYDSPESPVRGGGATLERRATTDATAAMSPTEDGKGQSSGFLARVKSLKGGKKQRPEPARMAPPAEAPPAVPGTAV